MTDPADPAEAGRTAHLPASARLLIEYLGERLGMKVINTWPGVKLRIPLWPDASPLARTLAEVFGAEDAASIMAQFGGEVLSIPVCRQALRDLRDLRIITAYGHGEPVMALALQYQLTTRQIANILKRTPKTSHLYPTAAPGQATLF